MTQRFFEFMEQEHGLILTQTQMQDIIDEAIRAADEEKYKPVAEEVSK